MTLSALKEAVAKLLQSTTSAFVSNGVDLLLVAINNAKNYAQQRYDFERARTSVSVSVNTTSGGSLANAVTVDGLSRAVVVKKVEAAFLSYQGTTNRPCRFVSKKGQVADAGRRYEGLEYAPSQASPLSVGSGYATEMPLIVQQNQILFLYPNATGLFGGAAATVYLDVVEWLPDYVDVGNVTAAGSTACDGTFTYYGGRINNKDWWINKATTHSLWYNSAVGAWWITSVANTGSTGATSRWALTSTSTSPAGTYTAAGAFSGSPVLTVSANAPTDFFLEYGAEFLLWRAIIEGNHMVSQFVPRQEGELPPPEKQADRAWQALIDWDSGLVASNTSEFDLL
jgi:ribosomal protein S9